jgi:hypothetical protein
MNGKIYLSLGMPRAGSGWHYNLIHDLVVASGGQDARKIRRRFMLQLILTEVNCNIGALTTKRLLPALFPTLFGIRYTVKAHAGPTPLALRLIQQEKIIPTYIYRDPRDAMLSAFEYGQRSKIRGYKSSFPYLSSIEKAIEFIKEYVQISEAWLASDQVLHVSYESFLTDYESEANRLMDFLFLDKDDPLVQAVIKKYSPEEGRSGLKGTHFVKGVRGRYRENLNAEQQQICLDVFGDYLDRMGYPIP